MLKTLTHSHYDTFGDLVEIDYAEGKVYNMPPALAVVLIDKGIAAHA